MGQRHMTYVITESNYEGKKINTIYNQWNFVKLQAWKLERVVKMFKNLKMCDDVFATFFAVYGLSPTAGWVGGYVANDEYNQYNIQPFGEDNNNGWTIIKIIETKNQICEYNFKIELCCIWGSEDTLSKKTTYAPVPTAKYFSIGEKHLKDKPEQLEEYRKTVDYIVLNTTYNPKLKVEAVKMIEKNLIKSKPVVTI